MRVEHALDERRLVAVFAQQRAQRRVDELLHAVHDIARGGE